MLLSNESWEQVEDCFSRIPSFEPELREAILFRIAGNGCWNAPWARFLAIAAKDIFITLLRSTVQTIQDAQLEKRTLNAIVKAIPEVNARDKEVILKIIADHHGGAAIQTNQISVLFMAAEPTNENVLRLGKEFREIQDVLGDDGRDDASLFLQMPQFATRPKDLLKKVLGFKPNVVHFSGHGIESGGLQFESQDGRSHTVEPEALSSFFSQCTPYTQCVLLNACYSSEQAKEISKHIRFAIGMSDKIGNADAVSFSIGFYTALSKNNQDFQSAFLQGRNMLQLGNSPYQNVPSLYQAGQQVQP